MSLEKAKKYLESKGCLDWKKCATPRAGCVQNAGRLK